MGTDIHGIFQRYNKATGNWCDIESDYKQYRDYQLFAVLAGVRNGTGFAGIKTGDAVKPISEPRGLPSDFEMDDDMHPIVKLEHMAIEMREYHRTDEELAIWMGEHSQSWLTGQEMLSWFEHAPTVSKFGVLDRGVYEAWKHRVYEAWKHRGNPTKYCGDINGPNVIVINDTEIEKEQTPNWTHIQCTWKRDLREELAYFFDEVARLVNEYGDVRFVFGFDS